MNFHLFTTGKLNQCKTNQNDISKEFTDMKFIDRLGLTNKEIEKILKVFNMK